MPKWARKILIHTVQSNIIAPTLISTQDWQQVYLAMPGKINSYKKNIH